MPRQNSATTSGFSTLNAYIEALGGQAHIIITFNGERVDLDLGALRRTTTPASS